MPITLLKNTIPFVTFILIILIGTASYWVYSRIEADIRTEVANSLDTVLDTTHQAVRSWLKEHRAATNIWANTPTVHQATKELLAMGRDKHTLATSAAQTRLRTWLESVYTGKGYQGYFIIAPDNINLASIRDQNIGVETLLAQQAAFLQKIRAGETAVSLPMQSDVPLPDKDGKLTINLPTMFVGAPVQDASGKVLAIFAFRINPAEDFTTILQQGRIGKTGETYAFDKLGRLISNSRFDEQLRVLGLIKPHEEAILNIKLRDPGVKLVAGQQSEIDIEQQSFTRMAASAIAGESASDLTGYRDYRGVSVVGAWLWDDELGFGITTEMDVAEAYQTLRATRYTIASLTLLLILLSIGILIIYLNNMARKRAQQALQKSEARLANFFEASFEGIFLHENGKILDVNPATTAVFGYAPETTIGRNLLEFIAPESRELVMTHMAAGHEGPYEVDIVRIDGSAISIEIRAKTIELEGRPVRVVGLRDITERKLAEKALRESDQYNRMLFEESTIGLALCRLNGDLVDINPSFASILGRSVEETLKLTFWDITPEKYVMEERAQLANLEKTGRYGPYEKEYIHADGHLVPVRLLGQILEKGGEKFIWSSVEDITERTQAEKALQRSEVLERLATGASLNEILTALVINAEKRSPEMLCSMLLLDDDGKHLRHGAAPSLPDFYNEAIAGVEIGHDVGSCGAAAFTGERVIVDDIMTHSSWLNYRELANKAGLRACWSEPVISSSGDILGTFAIYYREPRAPQQQDLDFIQDSARLAGIAIERKLAEDALRESEERYRSVVQQQTKLICRFNPDFTLTLVNKAYCRYFGKSEQELLGMNFFTLIPEEEQESVQQHFASFTPDERVQVQQYYVIAPDGSIRWQQWTNQAYFDKSGKIIGFQAEGIDITERKHADEKKQQLLQQNRDLTQRMFQLQEQERQHLARELHDEFGQWLTAIQLNVQNISNLIGMQSADVDACIESIANSATHIQKDILRMIHSLRPALLDELGLADSLRELVDQWQGQHSAIHCELVLDGDLDNIGENLSITIYRLVQEGLTNVAKHAQASHVDVQLQRKPSESAKSDSLILTITDDGKGFDPNMTGNGFGLPGMRERVLASGGAFSVKGLGNGSGETGVRIEVELSTST